jgi:hypothetical protein
MSTNPFDSSVKWLSFSCPSCRADLRIKDRYATMRGRCPECGMRIDPLQPSSKTTEDDSEEILRLVPIEEEWPEPARVAGEEEGDKYGLAEGPLNLPEKPPAAPLAEGYGLAMGEEPLLPRASREEFEAEAIPVFPAPKIISARAAVLPDPEKVKELLPEPPPPPPLYPLWSGIYTFPWHQGNLGVWFFQALNFSFMSLLVVVMLLFFDSGGVLLIGVILVIPMVALAFFWSGMYAANCFIANVEETAAGNNRVSWPKGGGLLDGLGKFIYLLWIIFCSAIPVIFIAAAQRASGGSTVSPGKPGAVHPHAVPPSLNMEWLVPLLPWLLLFPILLLSSLKGGWWWHVLDGNIAGGIFRKPKALFLVCVPPAFLIFPSVWLAQSIIVQRNISLAALSGLLWSTALLIYGRLLGRAGWVLTDQGDPISQSRKKPRKSTAQVAEAQVDLWGGVPE